MSSHIVKYISEDSSMDRDITLSVIFIIYGFIMIILCVVFILAILCSDRKRNYIIKYNLDKMEENDNLTQIVENYGSI